jgi:hypothetical protein
MYQPRVYIIRARNTAFEGLRQSRIRLSAGFQCDIHDSGQENPLQHVDVAEFICASSVLQTMEGTWGYLGLPGYLFSRRSTCMCIHRKIWPSSRARWLPRLYSYVHPSLNDNHIVFHHRVSLVHTSIVKDEHMKSLLLAIRQWL